MSTPSRGDLEDEKSPSMLKAMFLAILIVSLYLIVATFIYQGILALEYRIILLIIVFLIVANSNIKLSIFELKRTYGVSSAIDLQLSKIISSILSGIIVGSAFVTFITVTIEGLLPDTLENDLETPFFIAPYLIVALALFLVIFPFFDFYVLSLPEEEGALPFQNFLSRVGDLIRAKTGSPFIAALFLYIVFYVFPIITLKILLRSSFLIAILVWALILPILNLGYVAGIGIGEDLLSLKYLPLRKYGKIKNFHVLKFSFKDSHGKFHLIPRVQIGRLALVLFGILAILTTLVNIGKDVLEALRILPVGSITIVALYTTLANKGRGAAKEFSALWEEGGFKVHSYRLIIPSFFISALMLNYVIDLLVNYPISYFSLATVLSLNQYYIIFRVVLILQEFIFLMAVVIILFSPFESVETRLAYSTRDIFSSIQQFNHAFHYFKNMRSKITLLRSFKVWAEKHEVSSTEIPELLIQALQSPNQDLRYLSVNTIDILLQNQEFNIIPLIPHLPSVEEEPDLGVKLLLIRIWTQIGLKYEDFTADAIDNIAVGLRNNDIAVRWEAGNGLRKLCIEKQDYAAYAQGLVIKTLIETDDLGIKESCISILGRFAEINLKLSQMSLNVLLSFLREQQRIDMDVVVKAFSELTKKRPALSVDLMNEIMGMLLSEIKSDKLIGIALVETLLVNKFSLYYDLISLTLDMIKTEDTEIQSAVAALLPIAAKSASVSNEDLYNAIQYVFQSDNETLIFYALSSLEEALNIGRPIDDTLITKVKSLLNSSSKKIITATLKILSQLILTRSEFLEFSLEHAKKYLDDNDPELRAVALNVLMSIIQADPETALLGVPIFKQAIEDTNPEVRIVATNGLGVTGAYHPRYKTTVLPLLNKTIGDTDWRVRLATVEAIQSMIKIKESVPSEIIDLVIQALIDPNGTVRNEARATVNIILEISSREHASIYNSLLQLHKQIKDTEIRATILLTLGDLTEIKPIYTEETIKLVSKYLTVENISYRLAIINVIDRALKRYEQKRNVPLRVLDSLDNLITQIMKAANSADPSIRRTAYETLVVSIKYLDENKVFQRGRKTLMNALEKHEKDPALKNFLESALVRTAPLRHAK